MDWKIQLCELNYDEREKDAVSRVLESEWLTMGATVAEFEDKFSSFLGSGVHSVAVSSATAALHLLLMAIGVGARDEVIMPGLTFVSDANVVMQLGAKPVFADSRSLSDLNVCSEDVIKKISSNTKAIIIVHFAGYPAELTELQTICKAKGIFLIEDVAHAPGAEVNNKKCGTFGDAAFFSFFSNKNLACGEGGMVVTANKSLAKRLAKLRSHGMTLLTAERHKGRSSSYDVEEIGLNYRFDEIRAAIGIVQLEKLITGNLKRRALTNRYRQGLEHANLTIPFEDIEDSEKPAYHIFPVILPDRCDRNWVIEQLKKNGIQASIHYPSFANFSAYKDLLRDGDLQIVDQITKRELTLPLHPRMSMADVDKICTMLRDLLN